MNLNCDITKDLVSLYKDGIVSRATKIVILKHLCQCPDCRKYYRAYDKFLEDFDEDFDDDYDDDFFDDEDEDEDDTEE